MAVDLDALINQADANINKLSGACKAKTDLIDQLQKILEQEEKELRNTSDQAKKQMEGAQQRVDQMQEALSRDLANVHSKLQEMVERSNQLDQAMHVVLESLAQPLAQARDSAEQHRQSMNTQSAKYHTDLQGLTKASDGLTQEISNRSFDHKNKLQAFREEGNSADARMKSEREELVSQYEQLEQKLIQGLQQLFSNFDQTLQRAEQSFQQFEGHVKDGASSNLREVGTTLAVDTARQLTNLNKSLSGNITDMGQTVTGALGPVFENLESTVGKVSGITDELEVVVKIFKLAKDLGLV